MPFITLINGEPRNVRQATEEEAWAWLDGWTYSGPDAVKTVEEVPAIAGQKSRCATTTGPRFQRPRTHRYVSADP